MNKQGLALLLATVLLSGLLLACITVWKTTMYVVEYAIDRQLYIQRKTLAEGLLQLAIQSAIKEPYDQKYLMDKPSFIPDVLQPVQAQCILKKITPDKILLEVQLQCMPQQIMLYVGCTVIFNKNQKKYSITDWYVRS